MSTERVQKILAQAGIASRRKAEEMITQGLVTINGKVAKLGDKADFSSDAIKVDGKLLRGTETLVYVAFHKPKGVISMFADPQGRATLAEFLGKIRVRLFPIGRLDFNSEGLLLLTNDGEFAQKLQTRDDIPRVYQVKVKGHPSREDLARLERGTKIEGKLIQPHSVRVSSDFAKKSMIEVAFVGSGAIDVKTFFEMKGLLTERMIRTAIGHISLKGLMPGEHRLLKQSQVEALLNQPELGMRLLNEESEKEEAKRERTERFRIRAAEREAEREATQGPRRVIAPRKGGARIEPVSGPRPRRAEGDYIPHTESFRDRTEGRIKPRAEGEYKPRMSSEGGYKGRSTGAAGGGYKPRTESGFKPRGEGGGFVKPRSPRSEGAYNPRPNSGEGSYGSRDSKPRGYRDDSRGSFGGKPNFRDSRDSRGAGPRASRDESSRSGFSRSRPSTPSGEGVRTRSSRVKRRPESE